MIKQAYFRGLMKVAASDTQQIPQQQRDAELIGGAKIPVYDLQHHGFYKSTPSAGIPAWRPAYDPAFLRFYQAINSAQKFAPSRRDHVRQALINYYKNIGQQNRDFYLKQGFRPPADYQYKTPFPFPNHPRKNQMMRQNQHQVRNTRGQQYNGHV